ncbi:hypothetical protein D3C76_1325520 [compost metagenome]
MKLLDRTRCRQPEEFHLSQVQIVPSRSLLNNESLFLLKKCGRYMELTFLWHALVPSHLDLNQSVFRILQA